MLEEVVTQIVPLFHSRGTKQANWDAKVALGQDQRKAYIILNGKFRYERDRDVQEGKFSVYY